MAPVLDNSDLDWAVKQVGKCIKELVKLPSLDEDQADLLSQLKEGKFTPPSVTITCTSGDMLGAVADASVDAIVMDPPYYDNVMYAELSDFFYVWLKRTAGHVVPELFTRQLPTRTTRRSPTRPNSLGRRAPRLLAGRDYQERMARIFEECRRVLKPNGIMTLMFTHKATGAWDALTKGLMDAGFIITACWPINTEAEGSLHIKDKSAANSTIFLVCRPRAAPAHRRARRVIGKTSSHWWPTPFAPACQNSSRPGSPASISISPASARRWRSSRATGRSSAARRVRSPR